MQSKSTTTTTVLPTSLSSYTQLKREVLLCLQQDQILDPELIQKWLHQGLQSMATLGASKEELLPVFRGLQVFALRENPSSGYLELHRTLAALDAELGPNKGGFSRLLDNALEAGAIEMPEQFDLEAFPESTKDEYQGILGAISKLRALDHLSHAFGLPIDLPSCALALHSFLNDLGTLEERATKQAYKALYDWIALRELPASITKLLSKNQSLTDLNQLSISDIEDESLIQPFLLWLLAFYNQRLPTENQAAENLNSALISAQLPPLEVLHRAQW